MLPLFALYLGATPEEIGFAVGVSTVTVIFFKLPSGAAMGTFGTIFDIGHASGPILAGFLIARWGYLYSFLGMAAVLAASVPFFIAAVSLKEPAVTI